MFLGTCRMEFCQPRRQFLDKSSKTLLSTYDYVRKKIPEKCFSLKCSYGHVDCSFKNPDKLSLKRAKKNFSQCPKTVGKLKNYQKNNHPRNVPSDL